jgi:chromate reductase, NAD(P)H dehydrogenase (quinone)
MKNKKKVITISGSPRLHSPNHKLINAIAVLSADKMEIILFESIAALPHFNPDDNPEKVDKAMENFRQQLRDADGVIICTPEYAHGVRVL